VTSVARSIALRGLRCVAGPTFRAFQGRNFRWLWVARSRGSGGFQIHDVARGWLAYSVIGSARALIWVDAVWSVATQLSPAAGGKLCAMAFAHETW
jgi:hypothetical protein